MLSQTKVHALYNQYLFWAKFLPVFFTFDTRKLANKMHVNWHARLRIWHVVWLVREKKTTRELTLWKIEMTFTTSHVRVRGAITKENVDVNWHYILFFKTSRDIVDWSWTSSEICQTYTLGTTVILVIKSCRKFILALYNANQDTHHS